MKKLNAFLLKSYIGPLVLTFCIGVLVLLLQFLWKYVDDLVGKGLDLWTICKFMFYASWTFVPMALPLAVLLSSLMFFGSMGEHYELVALKAAGIPLRRSMRPLIGVCLGVCVIAFLFANYGVPKAYLNYRLIYHEIRTKKPALDIPEGVYYKQLDGYTIRVDKKERDGKHLRGVQIYDHTGHDGNTNVTMAERGYMQISDDARYMALTLYNGHTYGEKADLGQGMRSDDRSRKVAYPFTRIQFEKQILLFDLESFKMPEATAEMYERHQRTMDLKHLSAQYDTLAYNRDIRQDEIAKAYEVQYYHLLRHYGDEDTTVRAQRIEKTSATEAQYTQWKAALTPTMRQQAAAKAESFSPDAQYYRNDMYYRNQQVYAYGVEWHKKFSLSVACLIMFFIGAPLGSIIRKGGLGMPVVVSVLLFVLYHVISVIGEKSAIEGVMSCFWGMWMAPLIYLPFGIILTIQATVDASFLDADTYRRLFSRKKEIA